MWHQLAEQNLMARLLQPIPLTAEQLSVVMIQNFLTDTITRTSMFDWTLHVRLLTWLKEQTTMCITEAMIKELLSASVVQWAMRGLEHITARGMIVTSCYSNQAAALWKSQDVAATHKLIFMQLPARRSANAFALINSVDNQGQLNWVSL